MASDNAGETERQDVVARLALWAQLPEAIWPKQNNSTACSLSPTDAQDLEEIPPWAAKALQFSAAKNLRSTGAHAVVQPWLRDARGKLSSTVRSINDGFAIPLIGTEVVSGLALKLEEDLLELAIRPVLLEAEIAERTSGTAQAYHDYLPGKFAKVKPAEQ